MDENDWDLLYLLRRMSLIFTLPTKFVAFLQSGMITLTPAQTSALDPQTIQT